MNLLQVQFKLVATLAGRWRRMAVVQCGGATVGNTTWVPHTGDCHHWHAVGEADARRAAIVKLTMIERDYDSIIVV